MFKLAPTVRVWVGFWKSKRVRPTLKSTNSHNSWCAFTVKNDLSPFNPNPVPPTT
ncbi:MAG: hypothetical protein ACK448_05900 [Bacteroidota bacterium]